MLTWLKQWSAELLTRRVNVQVVVWAFNVSIAPASYRTLKDAVCGGGFIITNLNPGGVGGKDHVPLGFFINGLCGGSFFLFHS